MTRETAMAAVDRLFESDSPELTVEFQGGEPLLAFDTIRAVTEEIERRNADHGRTISFSITSTLHQLTEEMAEFFRRHCFRVSTSLDGPQWLHNWNRPTDGRDGYRRTLSGLALARTNLGHGNVAALTTLTRESLAEPEAIVDAYVDQGFRSIFLRPLSPYGFAARSVARIGYSNDEFLAFYRRALAHILELNRSGVPMEEAYAGILLSHILTPWASGYVDLRSPAGAGFGCLVYNYDGSVYPSDEARMLAEMGDDSLRFGSVEDNLDTLYRSDAMRRLVDTGVAESLPRCSDCAFVPFCGADPVLAVRQGKAGGPSGPPEDFCGKHTGLFQILFEYLAEADPFVMRTFVSWATRREPGIPAEIL